MATQWDASLVAGGGGQLPCPPVRPGRVLGHGRVGVVAPVGHQLEQHGHGEQPEPCPDQGPAPWCRHAAPLVAARARSLRSAPSAGRLRATSGGLAMGDGDQRHTESGIPIQVVYGSADLDGFDPGAALGEPGQDPFTRGIYPTMYRGRAWTMRQYAGFGSAAETNARFRYLLDHGQTGLSVAFDLPTQMGLDSDHPRAEGEVGKTGVAIDSIEDMGRLLDRIPLDEVSTSMTINATAPILLLLYELVAEERGIEASALNGTVQNDLLKEYAARGTYIYPPRPSMRLITDLFAYCGRTIPRWNTISVSGYHMREAGATAVQEVAFTLADGIAYVEAAIDAGLEEDGFAPRLSFFF